MKPAVIIGRGMIASALAAELRKAGCRVACQISREGVYRGSNKIDTRDRYLRYCKGVSCAFVAISTNDDGKAAASYIKEMASKGIPVVTCEKGSLANYFPQMRPILSWLGINATVGGGTRFLDYLKSRGASNITELYAVNNGTLNFIFGGLQEGRNIQTLCKLAIKNGYTDLKIPVPLDIINSELRDVLLKAVITFNLSGLSKTSLSAKEICLRPISQIQLKLMLVNRGYRMVISITKQRPARIIGGFSVKKGSWYLVGGFRKISEPWLPTGVNNAFLIRESENAYLLQGPGAGPRPTALSMIRDAKALLAGRE